MNYGTAEHKARAAAWFRELRDDLCARLEALEDALIPDAPMGARAPGRFERRVWTRGAGDTDGGGAGLRGAAGGGGGSGESSGSGSGTGGAPGAASARSGGGGETALLRGRALEKAGVNVSAVEGEFSAEFRTRIPGAAEDPRFWAAGVSAVIHPVSPLVPAAHMNTRMIVTTEGWFGGGADLTPVFPDGEETARFHGALKAACAAHGPGDYPRFKQWCDEYFYLPHRGEPRGEGGIFFDSLNTGDWEADFAFVQDAGRAFAEVYPEIARRRMNEPWTEEQRQAQRVKRGRYVEFNLIYDRGTLFGLKTGGDTEAVLMSLPPDAGW